LNHLQVAYTEANKSKQKQTKANKSKQKQTKANKSTRKYFRAAKMWLELFLCAFLWQNDSSHSLFAIFVLIAIIIDFCFKL
jgi:hypothetical protein